MPPPAATQAAARLWTQPTSSFSAPRSYRSSVDITRTAWWQTRFTRGRVREWRSGHNSVSDWQQFEVERTAGRILIKFHTRVNFNAFSDLYKAVFNFPQSVITMWQWWKHVTLALHPNCDSHCNYYDTTNNADDIIGSDCDNDSQAARNVYTVYYIYIYILIRLCRQPNMLLK
jgi:hypothetical protein